MRLTPNTEGKPPATLTDLLPGLKPANLLSCSTFAARELGSDKPALRAPDGEGALAQLAAAAPAPRERRTLSAVPTPGRGRATSRADRVFARCLL